MISSSSLCRSENYRWIVFDFCFVLTYFNLFVDSYLVCCFRLRTSKQSWRCHLLMLSHLIDYFHSPDNVTLSIVEKGRSKPKSKCNFPWLLLFLVLLKTAFGSDQTSSIGERKYHISPQQKTLHWHTVPPMFCWVPFPSFCCTFLYYTNPFQINLSRTFQLHQLPTRPLFFSIFLLAI